MPKCLVFAFLFFLSFLSKAQNQNIGDTLTYQRVFLHTNVFRNSIKLNKGAFSQELLQSRKWTKRNKLANIMIPTGPIISLGGIYLAYDAIKGIPMVWTDPEDGAEYPYVVRSLPKLLGGLAAFVTGLSLVESGNEVKMNAVKWHNEQLKKDTKTAFELRFGISKSGGIGLTANF